MLLLKTKLIRYILILSFLFYSIPCLICLHPESPDEVDYQYTSTLLSQTGRMWFESKGDAIFGEEGFIPRHFSYNFDGKLVPYGSPGFILFSALLKLLLPDFMAILINPLLAVVCIYLIYRVSEIIFDDERKSLYAAILFASMPLAIHSAYSIISDLLNLTIFLITLLLILTILQNGNKKNYILLGIFIGLLPWVRQSSVILFIPLGIFILLYRKKLLNRNLVLTLIIAALFVIGLLSFNLKIFGWIFATGHLASKSISPPTKGILSFLVREIQALSKILQLLHIRPDAIPNNILNNFRYAPSAFLLIFPPIIFSMFGLYYARFKEISRKFLVYFILLAIVFILFFSIFKTYGLAERNLTFNSSFLRYLLPFFALLPIFAVIGIFELGNKIKIVFYTLLILNLTISVFGPHGLAEDIGARLYYREASHFLLENTNEKSVVFSWYWDKSVFPDRIVYTKKDLTNDELSKLIDKITGHNYNIYYVHHKYSIDKEKFFMNNYDLEIIKGPILRNPFLRFINPPQNIYPIKLYEICGHKK